MRSISCFALMALSSTSTVQAHSWIEQMTNVASNGSYVGALGFPRGFVSRSDPGFNDEKETYRILDISGSDVKLCNPNSQTLNSQGKHPRLQSSPGAVVALQYQENGHVSLPSTPLGKPERGGTVYIYATQQPKTGEKLYDVYQKWSKDGSGGDKRGKLLSTQWYDDGQCSQLNNGPISKARLAANKFTPSDPMGANLWCQNNIVLPNDVDTSKPLTLYWVWVWNTIPGVDPNAKAGKNETYTSCMDINLTPASKSKVAISMKYVKQDVQRAALGARFNSLSKGNLFDDLAYTNGMTPKREEYPLKTASSLPPPPFTAPPSPAASTVASTQTSNGNQISAADCNAGAVPTVYIFGSSTGTASPTNSGLGFSTSTQGAITAPAGPPRATAVAVNGPLTFSPASGTETIPVPAGGPAAQTVSGQPDVFSGPADASTPTNAPNQAAVPTSSKPPKPMHSAGAICDDDPVVEPVPISGGFSSIATPASGSDSALVTAAGVVSSAASRAASALSQATGTALASKSRSVSARVQATAAANGAASTSGSSVGAAASSTSTSTSESSSSATTSSSTDSASATTSSTSTAASSSTSTTASSSASTTASSSTSTTATSTSASSGSPAISAAAASSSPACNKAGVKRESKIFNERSSEALELETRSHPRQFRKD